MCQALLGTFHRKHTVNVLWKYFSCISVVLRLLTNKHPTSFISLDRALYMYIVMVQLSGF